MSTGTIDTLQIEIEASSNDAAAKIEELTKALRRLKNQADKGTGLEKVKSDLNGIGTNAAKTTKAFNAIKSGLKLLSFRQIVNYLGDAVTSINDYVENLNLFQVSMRGFYKEAYEYAMLVNEKLGVDPSAWMRTQGVFMSMGRGFGMTEQQAYDLSESLTELSYDIGSLYNEDVERASLRLQSALAGEIEPIRRLGISISQATLQEYALSKGIDESVASMTEQEKALLRSLKLIEGASDIGAIGDFARTLESPANALRVFSQQIEQLKRSIGSVLLPIIIQVLPYMQAFVSILTDAISRLATLLGLEMPSWDNSAWENAYSGAADAVDDTTAAVKKLKRETIGIDELNILGDKSGSGNVGGVSGWASSLEIPNLWDQAKIQEIETQASAIQQKIEDALGGIEGVLLKAPIVIGALLALSGVNVPLGLAMIAGGLIMQYKVAEENWSTADEKIQDALLSTTSFSAGFLLTAGALMAFSGASIPLGIALMAAGLASAYTTAKSLNWEETKDKVSATMTVMENAVGGLLIGLGSVLALSGVNIPLGIALMAGGAAELVASKTLKWDAVSGEIESTVARITALVSVAALALGAILAFTGVNLPIGIALMAGGAVGLAASIGANWNVIPDNVRNTLSAIAQVVGLSLLGIGAILALSGAALPLGLGLMAAGGISLVASLTPRWGSIVDSVRNTFENVKNVVRNAINTIKDWLSEPIDVEVNYSSWTGKGFNLASPYASGGFPDHGEMFIAREAGPELVGQIGRRTAVANNDQIVEGIAQGVANANGNVVNAIYAMAQQIVRAVNEQSGDIYLDYDKVGRKMTQYASEYARARG